MTDFLVRHFIKNWKQVEKVSVRTAYTMLSGFVGIFCNLILFVLKGTLGFLLQSISVSADAFNNLSDAVSAAVALAGAKMAEKPADSEHPFGHGRIEYISALIVSFIVIQVGLSFLKNSFSKILHPLPLHFQGFPVALLTLSVFVKLWLAILNRKLGVKIDSKLLKAVSVDSVGDVLTTLCTIFSLVFFFFTRINIDGFVGLGVSAVIIWSGIGVARDTIGLLIGKAATPERYLKIKNFVEKYEGIQGTHDLVVHDYGPARSMATIRAEVATHMDIGISHEIVDRIEKDAKEQLGITLVIHMDPVETENAEVIGATRQPTDALSSISQKPSIHDFRVTKEKEKTNLIFDMSAPLSYCPAKEKELKEELQKRLAEKGGRYHCAIRTEYGFIPETKIGKRKKKEKRRERM